MNSQKDNSKLSISRELETDESTPLKLDGQCSLNLTLSPIVKRLSLNTTFEDIDSAYYSRLKGGSPSIHSIRSPSITSIRSPSKFTKKLPNLVDLFDSSTVSESNDLLSWLFERSIFHVLRKIFDYLDPKDYAKLFTVCKKWNQIATDDLNHNFRRKLQIIQLKRNFLATKENIKLKIRSIEEIDFSRNMIECDGRSESVLEKLENSDLRSTSTGENFKQTISIKSFTICSRKNRKNLKRL